MAKQNKKEKKRNVYAMCFMGIAGYLTFRSHVKKLFGWWCHCPNDDLTDINDNYKPLQPCFEYSILQLDKICQRLQYILNKNNGN